MSKKEQNNGEDSILEKGEEYWKDYKLTEKDFRALTDLVEVIRKSELSEEERLEEEQSEREYNLIKSKHLK